MYSIHKSDFTDANGDSLGDRGLWAGEIYRRKGDLCLTQEMYGDKISLSEIREIIRNFLHERFSEHQSILQKEFETWKAMSEDEREGRINNFNLDQIEIEYAIIQTSGCGCHFDSSDYETYLIIYLDSIFKAIGL